MTMTLAIITTTYNRACLLRRLYKSLESQNNKNFKWIVIDDGSTDDTSTLVKNWEKLAAFEIQYIEKKNGGKHTALNLAFSILDTDLMVIVDSDDYLTNDAVSDICRGWRKISDDSSICGMMFLRANEKMDRISGMGFHAKEALETVRKIQKQKLGEKVYVIRSAIMKELRFPEYEGEKYVPEGYIWHQLGKYKILTINKIIYVGEYTRNGLTLQGRELRLHSINGMIDAGYMAIRHGNLLLKNSIRMICYYNYATKEIRKEIRSRHHSIYLLFIFWPIGKIISGYWHKKYA